jgi:hypothetical protein
MVKTFFFVFAVLFSVEERFGLPAMHAAYEES